MSASANQIYLDNAATTFPKPEIVWQTMDEFARSGGANANRGQNPLARRAARLIEETRAKVAEWLDIPKEAHITFAPSATIALNQIILGSPLQNGDFVYHSPFEHNSILRPLTYLQKTNGIELREIPFHSISLQVEWDKLEALWLSQPPRMLAISQASNVCGLLLPVEELANRARKINPSVIVVVDGAQAAGFYPLNLNNGNIDYLIWSGHKSFYGPFGVAGIAFCSSLRPEPILFGGTGTVSESLEMPNEFPSNYEPGSHNSPAIAGLNAALSWLNDTGREAIISHTSNLTCYIKNQLSSISGIKVINIPNEKSASVLSFSIMGITPQALEKYLGEKNIAVRAGLHCAPYAHRFFETLNKGGTVRISVGYFNTLQQSDIFLQSIENLMV